MGPVHPWLSVWVIQPDPKRRLERPSTDIDLSCAFIREDDTPRAKHVRLDVHLAPCQQVVVHQTDIQFVGTSRVGELGRAPFFEERHLVVDTHRRDQRDDEAAD